MPDGNIFEFRNGESLQKIRLLCVRERVQYLEDSNLKTWSDCARKGGYSKKVFAVYTEEYTLDAVLTDDTVRTNLEHEVMEISRRRAQTDI